MFRCEFLEGRIVIGNHTHVQTYTYKPVMKSSKRHHEQLTIHAIHKSPMSYNDDDDVSLTRIYNKAVDYKIYFRYV
jgi:hypothetical protein